MDTNKYRLSPYSGGRPIENGQDWVQGGRDGPAARGSGHGRNSLYEEGVVGRAVTPPDGTGASGGGGPDNTRQSSINSLEGRGHPSVPRPIATMRPFHRPNAYSESTEKLHRVVSVADRYDGVDALPDTQVVGSTQLFESSQMRYIPTPTPDPKDPLNLPEWRKWAAVGALCFFGSLALAAETIVGALIPVFVLLYSGIDPKILGQIDPSTLIPPKAPTNSSSSPPPPNLLAGFGGPPLWQVTLLASLPLLVNGLASYILVPLSIGVGRRPVLLAAGLLAWAGGLWAGCSQSLGSHLAARALQGFGAGAVEAVIPLIVQDMMFIHQRNRAISSIGASQGLIVVVLGMTSPLIVTRLSWRWIYWLTSGAGVIAWLGLIVFVPETRWMRSNEELAGKALYPLRPGETRPRLDPVTYGPRDNTSDFGVLHVAREWAAARASVRLCFTTAAFPNVLWIMLVSALLVSSSGALGQVASTVVLGFGWRFDLLGLVVLPIVAASPLVWLFGGYVADRVSNAHARRHGGLREPEAHLLSLVLPLACSIVGPLLFGWAADHRGTASPAVTLTAIFLIGFGLLTSNALFSVYLVEAYPAYAGPLLVNVSSFRLIIGFAMSFKATDWVQSLGFLCTFAIFSGAAAAAACLGLPLVYRFGKRIRHYTGRKLEISAASMAPPCSTDGNRSISDANSMRSRRGDVEEVLMGEKS